MADLILDAGLDALLDTAKLLPFLFLAYLLMEFLEHKSGNAAANWLGKSGKVGPLFGAALGILPQCGFSAAASGLYAGRIITTGTLIAVYLATSDEMLPVMISEQAPASLIFGILGAKFFVGVVGGFLVDFISRLLHKKEEEPMIEEFCEREHCQCKDHFAVSALKHTVKTAIFILILLFILTFFEGLIGEETVKSLLIGRPAVACLAATVVGLIPGCAPSVILTELYLSGSLPIGALFSGLLVNAGIGLALLFKNNRPVRDSFRVVAILSAIGIAVGLLVNWIV